MFASFFCSSSPSSSFTTQGAALLALLAMGVVACSGSGGGSAGGGTAGSGTTAGAGGGTAGAGGGTAGAGGATAKGCESPTPILQPDGSTSGFVKCADGSIDRVEKVACVLQGVDTCEGTEDTLNCTTSADCQAKPGGVCLRLPNEGPGTSACGCVYQCQTDADCGGNRACVCAGVSSTYGYEKNPFCAQDGNCTQPSDCASGECGLGEWNKDCTRNSHTNCRSPDDACRSDADCGGDPTQCRKTDVTGTWTCSDPTCTI